MYVTCSPHFIHRIQQNRIQSFLLPRSYATLTTILLCITFSLKILWFPNPLARLTYICVNPPVQLRALLHQASASILRWHLWHCCHWLQWSRSKMDCNPILKWLHCDHWELGCKCHHNLDTDNWYKWAHYNAILKGFDFKLCIQLTLAGGTPSWPVFLSDPSWPVLPGATSCLFGCIMG